MSNGYIFILFLVVLQSTIFTVSYALYEKKNKNFVGFYGILALCGAVCVAFLINIFV